MHKFYFSIAIITKKVLDLINLISRETKIIALSIKIK